MLGPRPVSEVLILKSLLLFIGFAAAVYLLLIRSRGWRVAHLSRRARTAHFAICLAIAGGAACATVYLLQDELLCPAGHVDPELQHTRMSSGKGGFKIVCRDDRGEARDGSLFAGLFALLGSAAIVFAGASAVWRGFGPPAPPAPPPAPLQGPGAPTDRRDRRRERKQAQHRRRGA